MINDSVSPELTGSDPAEERRTDAERGETDITDENERVTEGETGETADGSAEAIIRRLEEEMAEASSQRDELQDKFLRLAAEYDNYRKRSAKERETLYLDAKIETASKFLPVFDNLERALSQSTEDAAYQKGVELIMKQYLETLEKLGVTIMEAEGAEFDPNMHEAVMHIEDADLGENEVAEVLQKGFMMDGKVIRHAVVKVAN